MADPFKKQIRDAVATVLVSALGTAASVHKHRVRNFDQSDLPAVNVKVAAERNDAGVMGAVGVTLSLILEIHVAATDSASLTAADRADSIESQAIAALAGDGLGIDGLTVRWDNSEALESDPEAEVPVAMLETTFAVQLRVAEGDATTIIS